MTICSIISILITYSRPRCSGGEKGNEGNEKASIKKKPQGFPLRLKFYPWNIFKRIDIFPTKEEMAEMHFSVAAGEAGSQLARLQSAPSCDCAQEQRLIKPSGSWGPFVSKIQGGISPHWRDGEGVPSKDTPWFPANPVPPSHTHLFLSLANPKAIGRDSWCASLHVPMQPLSPPCPWANCLNFTRPRNNTLDISWSFEWHETTPIVFGDHARIWASVYKWRTPSRWRAEDLHKPVQLEGEGGLENPAMENQNGERIPMQRYFSAVRHMEQTVMFPSLLQGVLLEDQENPAESTPRRHVPRTEIFESGLPPLNEKALSSREEEAREKSDLEGLFRYHISGLYHVLTQLTTRANAVTSRYNEILGQINQNGITFR
ncbi:hypothetical protein E2320_005612, partial [Naja naja]